MSDYFYQQNNFRRIDFSCNSQGGAYCAEALQNALPEEGNNKVTLLDMGVKGDELHLILKSLVTLAPDVLVIIPCGRYRESIYKTITQAIQASKCRLSLVAGACVPDEPAHLLQKLTGLDGVMVGNDFSLLKDVVREYSNSEAIHQVKQIPGFVWKFPDGTISQTFSIHPITPPNKISMQIRREWLPITLSEDVSSDRYKKWLIDSSIGCPRKCIFCRTAVQSRRQGNYCWIPRQASEIVDELEEVINNFGLREFRFQDDNFIMPTPEGWNRCHEIADEIRKRGLDVYFQIMLHPSVIMSSEEVIRSSAFDALESVGLERVFLGVESGHDPTLNYYRKETCVKTNEYALQWLSQRRLLVICGAVVFHPRTTLEQIRVEHEFFRRWLIDHHVASLAPLTSYAHVIPGSELETEILMQDIKTADEAEFRPMDPSAAAALRAALILRRYIFSHDWFVFTIKRDILHYERIEGDKSKIIEVILPVLADASVAGLDATYEVIEAAAAGLSLPPVLNRVLERVYCTAERLSTIIAKTPFAPYWRASLYAKPKLL